MCSPVSGDDPTRQGSATDGVRIGLRIDPAPPSATPLDVLARHGGPAWVHTTSRRLGPHRTPSGALVIITVLAAVIAIAITAALTFNRFARSDAWRATVTPLASIIGSGFLICGPLLAREFGAAAALAMAALLLLAYAVGAVIRFNIANLEPCLAQAEFHDPLAWFARLTQGVLAMAYAVSVAYYLKLLAEFTLKLVPNLGAFHALASNLVVSAIILTLTALALGGGLRRVEHLAHSSVAVKIGVIGGLLTALALWWATHLHATDALPPPQISLQSVPMLLGLLITVQGFETSRYLGDSYPADLRIRTMRRAQWISAAIYIGFILLLTPFLGRAAHSDGVAGILDIMTFVAPGMAVFVLIGAVSSQLSAAVADSIGSGGLMVEVTRRRLGVRRAFCLAAALAVAVVWLTDPFQVVAVSSRAFALFYALQCGLAVMAARRTHRAGPWAILGFSVIGAICLVAALVGAPAE